MNFILFAELKIKKKLKYSLRFLNLFDGLNGFLRETLIFHLNLESENLLVVFTSLFHSFKVLIEINLRI